VFVFSVGVRSPNVEEETYIGGVVFSGFALGGWRASWPFARFTLNDGGARVSLRAPFRFLHRDVHIPWDEVGRVERYGSTGQRGIRFYTGTPDGRENYWDRRDGVVFWCTPDDGPKIVAALERRGISVDK
jgi:hypothetical protein